MARPIFERKNILITGGAGFIGSHLCDELVKQHKVICLDDFSTGREENINPLLRNPNFEFVRHDLTQPIDLEAEPSLKPFQVAFQGLQKISHLAGPTSPKAYLAHPIETLRTSAEGTAHALELAVKYEAKFLFTSSAAVYGEPMEPTPYSESYWGYVDPIGPRSAFSEGKRYAESLVVHYRQKHKLPAKIARLFNIYGPRLRLDDGRMIPEWITSALAGQPITVYGELNDTATFCYISDIIEGLIRFMKANDLGPINLGSAETLTMTEAAQTIIQLTGTSSSVNPQPRPPHLARQGTPNIRLAKEKLGWFPVVSLEEGLKRTIDYFRGARSIDLPGQ